MASKGRSFRTTYIDEFEVLIGKGDAENDSLTFREADPHDFWLHVSHMPGSHVVVRNPDRLADLPRSVLEQAAQLAVWYSKARGSRGKVEVHACRVSDVSKPRGFPAGKVTLRRWQGVRIYPKEPTTEAEEDE